MSLEMLYNRSEDSSMSAKRLGNERGREAGRENIKRIIKPHKQAVTHVCTADIAKETRQQPQNNSI